MKRSGPRYVLRGQDGGTPSYVWGKGLVVAALAAAALVVAAPGSARTSTAFAGSFQGVSSVITGFRQADGNTFISQTVQVVYAGDLSGPVVEQIDVVIHPDGTFNFKGVDVCTCTLAGTGLSGTIALPFAGAGDASGSAIGHFTIGDGTGGLANMHGVGTFESSDGGLSGPFSGVYHFDP
jgi:uncharacterized protein DUF3224